MPNWEAMEAALENVADDAGASVGTGYSQDVQSLASEMVVAYRTGVTLFGEEVSPEVVLGLYDRIQARHERYWRNREKAKEYRAELARMKALGADE